MQPRLAASAVLGFFLLTGQALAGVQPWSLSVYIGPNSQKYFGAVLQDFNLQSREVVAGMALDRKLAYFGYDIYAVGELQVSHTFTGHSNTVFSSGLGIECDKLFGFDRTSLTIVTGPSYALDPPYTSIGYKHRVYPSFRKKFLNAVGVEFASGLPFAKNWDWTVRMDHRSGAFGLYSIGDDDGLSMALGLKYHF